MSGLKINHIQSNCLSIHYSLMSVFMGTHVWGAHCDYTGCLGAHILLRRTAMRRKSPSLLSTAVISVIHKTPNTRCLQAKKKKKIEYRPKISVSLTHLHSSAQLHLRLWKSKRTSQGPAFQRRLPIKQMSMTNVNGESLARIWKAWAHGPVSSCRDASAVDLPTLFAGARWAPLRPISLTPTQLRADRILHQSPWSQWLYGQGI